MVFKMEWKAKVDILWHKKGDRVSQIQDNWKPYFDKVESVKEAPEVSKPKKTVKKKRSRSRE